MPKIPCLLALSMTFFYKFSRFFLSSIMLVIALSILHFFGSFKFPDNGNDNFDESGSQVVPPNPLLDFVSMNYLSSYIRDTSYLNSLSFNACDVPQYSDTIYFERINAIKNIIPITYNRDVRGFMNLYLLKKRPLVCRIIGRSYDYYPLFEQKLQEKNLPDELKHLSIIESALVPQAKSWASAGGLWQFIPSTARLYGLRVDEEVDERVDPEKSTEAAFNYLSDLHARFGDWLLAIAAYNCGPGNINKAIKKAAAAGKGRDFWSIKPFLPKETQGYVPAYIAACYIMNYYADHNLKAVDPSLYLTEWEDIEIYADLSLKELAKVLPITYEELATFNPSYEKEGKVSVKDEPLCFNLPRHLIPVFYIYEDLVYHNSLCISIEMKR
jgi:membrane-bound lytic murein transglycosylase D